MKDIPLNHPHGLFKTLDEIARFYDARKVGDKGFLGFRRSTDLGRLISCLEGLIARRLLIARRSLFLDMGCGDGRVNVLFSYLAGASVGMEVDEWTLDEYSPLKEELESILRERELPTPPDNIYLFLGDSTDEAIHELMRRETGIRFEDMDLFYTYLTMYDEFSRLIAAKAKKGAVFMVYGMEKIIPRLDGLRLITPERTLEGILALYQKD